MDSRHRTAAEVEQLYHSCVDEFGAAFDRLAYGYESDSDRRRDLVQEIHTALWLSLRAFQGRCSLRTWAYRVAHNTAASHVARSMRDKARNWVDLDSAEQVPDVDRHEGAANQRIVLDKLLVLIHGLSPVDRQVILLYLEGMDGDAIAEIAGVSPTNITTKIHRIKKLLAHQFQKGAKSNASRPLGHPDAVGLAVSEDDRLAAVCVEPAS
jgi:RNA polymerase sigma-70 factor, ECF subfamily